MLRRLRRRARGHDRDARRQGEGQRPMMRLTDNRRARWDETRHETIRQCLAVALLRAAGRRCDEKLSDVRRPDAESRADVSAAFSGTSSTRPIRPGVWRARVATIAQGARFAGNLNLADGTSYASARRRRRARARPEPFASSPAIPTSSYLIQKIEGAPGIVGERMPRTGGPYPDARPDRDHPPLDSSSGAPNN